MIKELTQFVADIPNVVRERAIEPKAGLHILIKFDGEGKAEVINSERYLGKKHGLMSEFLKSCAIKQDAAWMINIDKCLSKSKDIHSASPYCIALKRESWYGGDYFSKNKQNKPKDDIHDRIENYFSQCCAPRFGLEEKELKSANQLKNFTKNDLNDFLSKDEDYKKLAQGDYIVVYNDVDFDNYKDFYNLYISEGLFNTSDYNIEVDGEILGTSNFYNGFNSKKPFLTHQTASFDITKRITTNEAKALAEFQAYAGKKLFPNPIPIFIDKPELTQEAISIYHRSEDKKISHRDIIKELWKNEENLGNYYLLYFSAGAIQDFDYVAKFRYHLSDEKDIDVSPKKWVIKNVTEIIGRDKVLIPEMPLKSVFDFELIVIRELFNNTLIKVDEKNKEVSMSYFDEIDPNRPTLYTLLLKYRKPIYDYVYKSMRSGISRNQFEDICIAGIMDDLKYKEKRDDTIPTKLNIYFSLYQYFDLSKNPLIMPSKIEEHKAMITQVVDDADAHFTTDDAYAFGAGQLIYYLLSQSEAGERTHAVLEPFLQKTNHAHFNDAIAAILLKYKHAIGFDFKRFNKLAAEVLDYLPEKGLQDLRPFLLAGYFCPNILYSKKTDSLS